MKGRKPSQRSGERQTCHQPASRALHIPFHTGNLSGKITIWTVDHFKVVVQKTGTVQKGISMHFAISGIFSVFQPGNQRENPFLLRIFQARLKSDKIIHGIIRIVLAQLKNREGLPAGLRINETDGFHGPESGNQPPPSGHAFNGHAAFKNTVFLKTMNLRCLR